MCFGFSSAIRDAFQLLRLASTLFLKRGTHVSSLVRKGPKDWLRELLAPSLARAREGREAATFRGLVVHT